MQVNCLKCDADISDSYEPDDFSVGIVGGWYCDGCDIGVAEHEVKREPLDGDVQIDPVHQIRGSLGTPLSKISGRPGHKGYEEFCRIAQSWGYE